jgi:ferredoxin/flavodoxin---NADP+ reductase
MLVLTPEELAPTDATDAAIEAINGAGVREVVVVGRRGPVQAAWTPVELGELGDLAGADILVDAAELELDEASAAELEAAPATVKRNMDNLRDYASREPEGKPRAIRLRFLRSPVAILGDERVEAIELVRNELVERRAVATDERETLPTGLVFRSIGYHGVPLPDLPFDERRGTLPNDRGRVLGEDGSPLRGVYCAGWIKRGPTGVIGTNKKDAVETVALLLEDAQAGRLSPREDADLLDVLAERDGRPVLYAGWEEIDRVERAAGEPRGRPRIKLATWDELLAAVRSD